MYLSEADVQQKIVDDSVVKNGIQSALDIDSECIFFREDEYINGIIADFTLINNNEIKAILECKSGNINVTDYVRGIGQLYQYEYFYEEKISHKSYSYANDFNTVYFFPSSVLRNNGFNVSKFKYPESVILLEFNEKNNAVRKISKKELDELKAAENDNLITISQYYFRDNRIFEYYILLKYLFFRSQLGENHCNRKQVESSFLKKIGTINNGNWRNAFITLSNLGLINNKNMPTFVGKQLAILEYEDFAVSMYYSYLEPYFKEVYRCFEGEEVINSSNQDFAARMRKYYKNRDVLYLSQSNGRYISSWLNIMRDDYGIIDFAPRKNRRELVYNPTDLKDAAFAEKIRKSSVAYKYIEKYLELIKSGEN